MDHEKICDIVLSQVAIDSTYMDEKNAIDEMKHHSEACTPNAVGRLIQSSKLLCGTNYQYGILKKYAG